MRTSLKRTPRQSDRPRVGPLRPARRPRRLTHRSRLSPSAAAARATNAVVGDQYARRRPAVLRLVLRDRGTAWTAIVPKAQALGRSSVKRLSVKTGVRGRTPDPEWQPNHVVIIEPRPSRPRKGTDDSLYIRRVSTPACKGHPRGRSRRRPRAVETPATGGVRLTVTGRKVVVSSGIGDGSIPTSCGSRHSGVEGHGDDHDLVPKLNLSPWPTHPYAEFDVAECPRVAAPIKAWPAGRHDQDRADELLKALPAGTAKLIEWFAGRSETRPSSAPLSKAGRSTARRPPGQRSGSRQAAPPVAQTRSIVGIRSSSPLPRMMANRCVRRRSPGTV